MQTSKKETKAFNSKSSRQGPGNPLLILFGIFYLIIISPMRQARSKQRKAPFTSFSELQLKVKYYLYQQAFSHSILESFFSTTASAERKYTGFQLVESGLKKAPLNVIPQFFTPNFLRTWINQLSNHDRYLHKIALKLVRTHLLIHH
jgi:hypothetical protein